MHLMYPCIVCVFPNANQTVLQMLLISPSPEKGAIQDAGEKGSSEKTSSVNSSFLQLGSKHSSHYFIFVVCLLFIPHLTAPAPIPSLQGH